MGGVETARLREGYVSMNRKRSVSRKYSNRLSGDKVLLRCDCGSRPSLWPKPAVLMSVYLQWYGLSSRMFVCSYLCCRLVVATHSSKPLIHHRTVVVIASSSRGGGGNGQAHGELVPLVRLFVCR